MESPSAFFDRHRPRLMRYLDGELGSSGDPSALEYCDAVIAEWLDAFGSAPLPPAQSEERAFWYAVYALEELAELPAGQVGRFEEFLLMNLAVVRELVRRGQGLPLQFEASRPNGT